MNAVVSGLSDSPHRAMARQETYGSLTSYFKDRAINEPIFSVDSPGVLDRLKRDYHTETVMQSLTGGNNYQVQAVSINSLKVSTDNNATSINGTALTQKLDSGRADVQENMGKFVSDFKEVKATITNAVRDVSREQGMDDGHVLRSMGAVEEGEMGKAQLMGAAFSNAAMGPVISATTAMMNVVSQVKQDSGMIEDKKLQEIMAKALDQIRAAQSGPDSFMQLEQENGKAPQPKYDFNKIDAKQALAFVASRPEDQPEFKKLMAMDNALDGVEINHRHVSREIGVTATDIANTPDAQAIVVGHVQKIAEQEQKESPKFDSVSFALAGDMLAGVERMQMKGPAPKLESVDEHMQKQAANDLQYQLAPMITQRMGLRA